MIGNFSRCSEAAGGVGPCGACKFLRRKCVKGCIFAPYFDTDQGAAHFAAVHKVYGASNVSKLLLRIPIHNRLDAVATLCYEASARIKDPVYGCVAHIFALQQQVVKLQSELAYIQALLSTLGHPTPTQPPALETRHASSNSSSSFDISALMDPLQSQQASDMANCWNLIDGDCGEGDLQTVAREFVSRCFTGVRLQSSGSC